MDAQLDTFGDSQTVFGSTILQQSIKDALKGVNIGSSTTQGLQDEINARRNGDSNLQTQIDDINRSWLTINTNKHSVDEINNKNPMKGNTDLGSSYTFRCKDPIIDRDISNKHYVDICAQALVEGINAEGRSRDTAIASAITTEVTNRNSAITTASQALQQKITEEAKARSDGIDSLVHAMENAATHQAEIDKEQDRRLHVLETGSTTSTTTSGLESRIKTLEDKASTPIVDLDMQQHRIVNVSQGVNDNDAVTKKQLDDALASIPVSDDSTATLALGLGAASIATLGAAGIGAALMTSTGQAATAATGAFIGAAVQSASSAVGKALSGLTVKPGGKDYSEYFVEITDIADYQMKKRARLMADPAMAYLMSEQGSILFSEQMSARGISGLNELSSTRATWSYPQDGLLQPVYNTSLLESTNEPLLTGSDMFPPRIIDETQHYDDNEVPTVGSIRKLIESPWVKGRLDNHKMRLDDIEATIESQATSDTVTSISDRVTTLENYNTNTLDEHIAAIASALDDTWTDDQLKKNNVYDRFVSDQGKVNNDVERRVKTLEDAPDPVTDLSEYYTKNETNTAIINGVRQIDQDLKTAISNITDVTDTVVNIDDRLSTIEHAEKPNLSLYYTSTQVDSAIRDAVASESFSRTTDVQSLDRAINIVGGRKLHEIPIGPEGYATLSVGRNIIANVINDNSVPEDEYVRQACNVGTTKVLIQDRVNTLQLNDMTPSDTALVSARPILAAFDGPEDYTDTTQYFDSRQLTPANVVDRMIGAALNRTLQVTPTGALQVIKANQTTTIGNSSVSVQDLNTLSQTLQETMDQKDITVLRDSKSYTDTQIQGLSIPSITGLLTTVQADAKYATIEALQAETNSRIGNDATYNTNLQAWVNTKDTATRSYAYQQARQAYQDARVDMVARTDQLQGELNALQGDGTSIPVAIQSWVEQRYRTKDIQDQFTAGSVQGLKDYVDQQLVNISTGGVVDLSAYQTIAQASTDRTSLEQNIQQYITDSETTRTNDLAAFTATIDADRLARANGDRDCKAYTDQKINALVIPDISGLQSSLTTEVTNRESGDVATLQLAKDHVSTTIASYSTTTQMNSAISTQSTSDRGYTDTQVGTRLTQTQGDARYKQLVTYDTKVQSSDGYTSLSCGTGSNGISIKANNVTSGSIGTAVGQTGYNPLLISANDKLQFVSGTAATSLYSATGNTTNSVYIGSASDSTTSTCYDQLVIGNGTNRQGLVLSSGHSNTNIPYSVICNQATSSLPNLQIGPGLSTLTDSALYMYGDSVASSFPVQNQFTRRVGYTSDMTPLSTTSNELVTWKYIYSYLQTLNLIQTKAVYTIVLTGNVLINIGGSPDNTALLITKKNGSSILSGTGTHLYRSVGAPNCSTLRLAFATASDTVQMYHYDWSFVDLSETGAANDTQSRQILQPIVRNSTTAGTFYVDITKVSNGAANVQISLVITKL